jgi:[protein-PII] uridylyltransferase
MDMLAQPRAPHSVAGLRALCRDGKAELLKRFMESRASAPAATRLLKGLARHVDDVLARAWAESGLATTAPQAVLVAVGGYGRGELFPHSDVDVLVLLPNDEGHGDDGDVPRREALERFVTLCWDIGLEIGSSVRTVGDCMTEAQRDVTVQTAMLESRPVIGNRRLFNQLTRALASVMDSAAFLRAKTLELQQRHVKYEDTPYSLEPNCKESPGGLRDLQVVIWVARPPASAAPGASSRPRG